MGCESALEAVGVSFGYGSQQPVLRDVSFSVKKGDFAILCGINGAGKSTMMRLILGEIVPLGGSIRLFSEDIRRFRAWNRVGYLPQRSLVRSSGIPATAEELVAGMLYRRGIRGRERKEKALGALSVVGMGDYSNRLMGNLSVGQQQKVMIARAIVGDPEILLLDEPTAGVDIQSIQSIYDLFSQLVTKRGITLLMITHDTGRELAPASRTFHLENGVIYDQF